MLLTERTVEKGHFEMQTGWRLKPEGACKGEICIPLSGSPHAEANVDAVSLAEQMGLPVVTGSGVWAIGPESIGSRALVSAEAPPLVLPDLDGKPFDLASLKGQKVVVYAWAPY